jgi:hypothetical protein
VPLFLDYPNVNKDQSAEVKWRQFYDYWDIWYKLFAFRYTRLI